MKYVVNFLKKQPILCAVFALVVSLMSIFSLNSRLAHLPDNVPVNSPARPREAQTAKGSGAMNRKQKQPMSKNSAIVMVGVVAAIMISAMAEDPDAIIPAVVTIVVVASIAAAVVASNKTKAGKSGKKTDVELHRPFPQPTAMKTKQPPRAFRRPARRLRGNRRTWNAGAGKISERRT